MKRIKKSLLLLALAVFGLAYNAPVQAVKVDIYQYMGNSGNEDDTLTSQMMEATSVGVGSEGAPAKWFVHVGNNDGVSTPYVDQLPGAVSTMYPRQLPGAVTVDGNSYTMSGNRTWKIRADLNAEFFVAQFGPGTMILGGNEKIAPLLSRVTVACYYTIGSATPNGSEYNLDTIVIGGADPTWSVLQVHQLNYSTGWGIRAHGDNNAGEDIPIQPNKTYWINLHHDGVNGECKVAVYDPDDWSLVGMKSMPTPIGRVCSWVKIGRKDTHGPYVEMPHPLYTHFSHIMIDYTEAKFPLLPDIGSDYWVSPTGIATWANAKSVTPLDGTAACSLATANNSVRAGDTVYLRGGTYLNEETAVYNISPQNSGTENARITYSNYNNEIVTISGGDTTGVSIRNKSHITVRGINFYNIKYFMSIYNSHHNIVEYCIFNKSKYISQTTWPGAEICNNSQYNRVHHCTFSRFGGLGSDGTHESDMLIVGYWSDPADDTSHNLIENNEFFYGGHSNLTVGGNHNVFRDNYLHNEAWESSNGYIDAIIYGATAFLNLFEGNTFSFSGEGGGITLRTEKNIFRSNLFYRNYAGGVTISRYLLPGEYNHFYNNVFFKNGWGAVNNNDMGGINFHGVSTTPPYGAAYNVIKNNIFHLNKAGVAAYDWGWKAPNTIDNNWPDDGDPLFVYNGDGSDLTPFGAKPDFRLQPESPCIDAGTFLTTITSPSNTGTSFAVEDALYFMDGWGIEHVQGDEIQLFGTTQRARITKVDYDSNTITVNANLSWTKGQGISLAYEGSAPDLGAYEYVPTGPYLTVIAPNGGQYWVKGSTQTIQWIANDIDGDINIELYKNTEKERDIGTTQADAGSFAWVIPSELDDDNDYKVRISRESVADFSDNYFSIVTTLPSYTVTFTAGTGGKVTGTTSQTITHGNNCSAVNAVPDNGYTFSRWTGPNNFMSTINPLTVTNVQADMTITAQFSSQSNGGGGGDSGGGGGGGGGCFIAAVQVLNPWLTVFGLFAGWLVWTRRAKRRKNMIKFLVILTGICFLSGAVSAQIISDDRRINWSPGIPGGIPNYPVGVNVKDYGAVGDNAADDTVAIQNAINACSAGQAVYLPEGIYRTTTRLNVNKGIVIRGEGPSKTKILSDSTGDAIIIYVGVSGGGPTGTAVAINSGFVKDSSTIVVADASAFSVGDYVGIYQENEPGLVYPQGYSTTCTWCGFGGNYLTCMAQIAKITNKNGNDLTLFQPLYYGFQASLNPKIQKISMIQGFGLEDLGIEKIRNAGASSTGSITAFGLAYSWIKNVHSRMCLGAHVRMSYSYGCVIRDSFFDDAFWRTGSRSYGIFLIFSNSSNLIENNALYRVTPALCMEGGGSGNVFGYNFTKDSFHDNDPTWFMGASAITHGVHPYMNLFEGNKLEGISFDNTWGSSSHNTCFRNHITRACGQAIYGVKAVDVHEHNYYQNFVGNVLGLVGQTGTWGPAQCDVNNVMWRLGCLSNGAGGAPSDPDVVVRTLRHGNFSMIADDTEWDLAISDHTFPDSYYLTSKPTWFGSIPWPAIGPDVSGLTNKIPAQVRFESLPAIDSFTANPAAIAQGQSSVLSWTVTNADSLSINQGLGIVSGTSTTVSPAATTTYTLTATNGIGSSTAIVTVTVQGGGGGDSGGGGGGGCFIAATGQGSTLGLVFLPLFFLVIALADWREGKPRAYS